ncbi:annexin-2 receptor-like [Hippopotamus amphibius kiboko]|uniref:annexin-2 receptor-like n=1 Tax=Hippopotamus amphibius kiboko TaxID=575201 RepID=UPI002594120C|nr:annexin-2 receptor-like [Hippopotamus amphibius kiboko]
MEQHFLGRVKQAWESAEVAPELQPPAPIGNSADSEPWPLPFYPVLGESSGHRECFNGELLSSPCWRLYFVYVQDRLSSRAPSTLEPSPAQQTAAGEREPAEEPDRPVPQQFPLARPAGPSGNGHQDIETPDSRHPSKRRSPPASAWWSHEWLLSGCLEWIGHALRTLSCCCCCSVFGAKEPQDCSRNIFLAVAP